MDELRSLRISSLDEEIDDDSVEEIDNALIDETDDDEEDESVTLGFVKKVKKSSSLLRHFFPSKAGGVPAWLDPENLPSGRSCVCDMCGEPLHFLLQIYAPITDKDFAFHRMLYVFMCPSMACLLQEQREQRKRHPEKTSCSVKVFCCQLPRANSFYSSEAPKHDGTDKPSGPGAAFCDWCSTWKGNKICSNCKKARYCSEKHQVMHWRSSHKTDCQTTSVSSQLAESISIDNDIHTAGKQKGSSSYLWPEYEIIHEHESEFDLEVANTSGSNSLVPKDTIDASMKSLLNQFEGDEDKRTWATFQERLARAPEQVLRYCRDIGAKPLWPMAGGRASKDDIPKCRYCCGPLCFEFQVLPQLLYYFGVKNEADSLDWATIVVYSCEASCQTSVAYKEEFVWITSTDGIHIHSFRVGGEMNRVGLTKAAWIEEGTCNSISVQLKISSD